MNNKHLFVHSYWMHLSIWMDNKRYTLVYFKMVGVHFQRPQDIVTHVQISRWASHFTFVWSFCVILILSGWTKTFRWQIDNFLICTDNRFFTMHKRHDFPWRQHCSFVSFSAGKNLVLISAVSVLEFALITQKNYRESKPKLIFGFRYYRLVDCQHSNPSNVDWTRYGRTTPLFSNCQFKSSAFRILNEVKWIAVNTEPIMHWHGVYIVGDLLYSNTTK